MKSLPQALFFLSLFLLWFSYPAQAQHTFGARWEAPEDRQQAQEQLSELQQAGITILEIDSPLPSEVWDAIDELNFQVYGQLNIRFPVAQIFAEPDSLLLNSIERRINTYIAQPSVRAIELFENGDIFREEFSLAIAPYASQIKQATQENLYFSSDIARENIPSQMDFFIYNVTVTPHNHTSPELPADDFIHGYRYLPSAELQPYVSPLKHFLETLPFEKPIFFEAEWLFAIMDSRPEFQTTLSELASRPDAVFPVPRESLPEPNNSSSLPSLLLLLVWGSIAIHYSSSPLYRKSAFRYFRGHKFFIRDIFHRQMRSPLPALIIIFQNATVLAISVFAMAAALWNHTGFQALFHYLPALELFPNGPLSLAVWTFGLTLIFSFINIFWLYLAHTSIYSVTQVATIYAWPMQINFLLATVVIALFSSGSHPAFVVATTLVATVIFLLSFIFASVDIYKHLRSKAGLYLGGTAGIYIVLITITVILAVNSIWWDGIQLSLEF